MAGLLFLVIGVAGFLDPNLLGMHLTTTHDVVHILRGLLSLYFGFVAGNPRAFCTAFGFVYVGLGVLGFVAPGVVAALLGHAGFVSSPGLSWCCSGKGDFG